jgi:hypothetical protein
VGQIRQVALKHPPEDSGSFISDPNPQRPIAKRRRPFFEMKSRELNRLLDDQLTVDDFKASIADEVENYGNLVNKKGSTIDLRLNEDEEITLDILKFRKLLNIVIAGRLSNIHLAYICDCLTLAEKLTTDDKTKDLIFELADPEINGGFLDKNALIDIVANIS